MIQNRQNGSNLKSGIFTSKIHSPCIFLKFDYCDKSIIIIRFQAIDICYYSDFFTILKQKIHDIPKPSE